MPADSLKELTIALISLIKKESTLEQVAWALEPRHWVWRFDSSSSIFQSIYVDEKISIKTGIAEVAMSICKGLRTLKESEIWPTASLHEEYWSWDFPDKELAELENELRRYGSG